MHSIPIRRNKKTGDNYLDATALVNLLKNDQFDELNDPICRKAHDWLIWAVTFDDAPSNEDSYGRVEVGLEPGEPPTGTAMLRYRWEPTAGLFLHLGDILTMIDEKQRQFVATCREAGTDPEPHLHPFAFLKRRIEQIRKECSTYPGTAKGWDGA